ncbi:MAG TPA: hypothetical protein PK466_08795 [Thermotogota bacterium]|nr:hypothetical protein [Thermotogota bacterium]HPJ89218.1 hypothetical protein [Thermotogota bacterium]HPR96414.1 hypothetical protein [Thermotogota bacterium]
MKQKCLSEDQIQLYLKYLLGLELETINTEELTDIESHLYSCEACFEKIQKRYNLFKSIEEWDIDQDNISIKANDFIQYLRTIDTLSEEWTTEQQNLIREILSDNFDFNQPAIIDFFSKNQDFDRESLTELLKDENYLKKPEL